jgi:hypothetical protein
VDTTTYGTYVRVSEFDPLLSLRILVSLTSWTLEVTCGERLEQLLKKLIGYFVGLQIHNTFCVYTLNPTETRIFAWQ